MGPYSTTIRIYDGAHNPVGAIEVDLEDLVAKLSAELEMKIAFGSTVSLQSTVAMNGVLYTGQGFLTRGADGRTLSNGTNC